MESSIWEKITKVKNFPIGTKSVEYSLYDNSKYLTSSFLWHADFTAYIYNNIIVGYESIFGRSKEKDIIENILFIDLITDELLSLVSERISRL